jgi:hypothetical protein
MAAMTSHTHDELLAIQRCNAILMLSEALRATQGCTNAQGRAKAMVDYFANLRRQDKFDLISLLSLPPPGRSVAPSLSTPGTERPTARGI